MMVTNKPRNTTPPTKRVLVAMSGGVDSSVAAALFTREGLEVIGVTMRHFCFRKGENSVGKKSCCSLESIDDARRICDYLGIPHYTIDVETDFRKWVIHDFRDVYLSGRTPNPCVRCNQYVRFPWLLKMSRKLGANHIATGHYVRVRPPNDDGKSFTLLRGKDPDKDQSYFLWTLNQRTLSRTLFPLGEMSKTRVRDLAREFGIDVSEKPDSQEICFIPEGDYRDFLFHPGDTDPALQPGPIVTLTGDEIGRHNGVALYTVGQRRRLGISGRAPRYVIEIRPETKTLVVGDKEALQMREFIVEALNWISGDPPPLPFRCEVKIRYRHPADSAVISNPDSLSFHILFDKPQEAISPGQSAVFYNGDRTLGGGIIRKVLRRQA